MKIGTYLKDIEQKPVTCRPEESARDAANRLKEHGIGAMPVVGGDGKLIGMLSERDIVGQFATQGTGLADLTVADMLTESITYMSPEADFSAAMDTMNKHGFRHIPILDGDKLIGVISIRDVLVYAIANEGDIKLHPMLSAAR